MPLNTLPVTVTWPGAGVVAGGGVEPGAGVRPGEFVSQPATTAAANATVKSGDVACSRFPVGLLMALTACLR